jgi:hypothetical protein
MGLSTIYQSDQNKILYPFPRSIFGSKFEEFLYFVKAMSEVGPSHWQGGKDIWSSWIIQAQKNWLFSGVKRSHFHFIIRALILRIHDLLVPRPLWALISVFHVTRWSMSLSSISLLMLLLSMLLSAIRLLRSSICIHSCSWQNSIRRPRLEHSIDFPLQTQHCGSPWVWGGMLERYLYIIASLLIRRSPAYLTPLHLYV